MSDHQDWTTIVFKKKPVKKQQGNKKAATGAPAEGYVTVKKASTNAGTAGQPKLDSNRLRKIDNNELPIIPKVSIGMRQAISQGRQAKNITQKELAQQMNVKPSIIQDYENGKAIPNSQFLARMEKVLDTKINGK